MCNWAIERRIIVNDKWKKIVNDSLLFHKIVFLCFVGIEFRLKKRKKKLFSDGQCLMFLNQANRFGVHCTVIYSRNISNRVVCSVSLFEV